MIVKEQMEVNESYVNVINQFHPDEYDADTGDVKFCQSLATQVADQYFAQDAQANDLYELAKDCDAVISRALRQLKFLLDGKQCSHHIEDLLIDSSVFYEFFLLLDEIRDSFYYLSHQESNQLSLDCILTVTSRVEVLYAQLIFALQVAKEVCDGTLTVCN